MTPALFIPMSVSPTVWIVVIVVLILIFGASKLPDIARNLGKSAKVLKEELNDLGEGPKQVQPPANDTQHDTDAPESAK
ncbi:MAG: twin-arginine translocase TatA/TatE family subunit [Varibaculum sp.]|nr:twin-arginine translocase TatA/TatE family subunit [Varibaculum sp.]